MHTMNRLELERLHTRLLGMCIIKPTNILFWVNFCVVVGSFAGCLVGGVWFIDSIFNLSLLVGFAELTFIQAAILVIFPIFALLIAMEIMRIVIKFRVVRFLNSENPDIVVLERLLEAKVVSGLSVSANEAIAEYISDQQAGV